MKQLLSHRNRGLTLIELLVVVAIVGVLGIVIAKFQGDVFSYGRYFNNSFSTANSAQKLLRPMTEEIRSASASNNGAYPTDTIGDYSFSFYSDIDNDGLKDWVKYSISGTNLIKETIKPTGAPLVYVQGNKVTTTFMTGVRNQIEGVPMFTYYNDTYTGGAGGVVNPTTGALDTVRLIGVKIRIDSDTNQPPPVFEVSSQVSVRNLKIQQ